MMDLHTVNRMMLSMCFLRGNDEYLSNNNCVPVSYIRFRLSNRYMHYLFGRDNE